jgi:hypothetical protein
MNVFPSRYVPCPECGASLERAAAGHECDPERWLDFTLFQLRDALEGFERALATFLATPHGRFEVFYAERARAGPSTHESADP